MAAYLWLVWYQASTKASPKHWALAVTYELHERAYATFYEVGILRVFSQPPPLTHSYPRSWGMAMAWVNFRLQWLEEYI